MAAGGRAAAGSPQLITTAADRPGADDDPGSPRPTAAVSLPTAGAPATATPAHHGPLTVEWLAAEPIDRPTPEPHPVPADPIDRPTPVPLVPLPVRVATGPRHRAPAKPIAPALLGERGRHAVMTAALVAGVGVVGVSGATASAEPARGAFGESAQTLPVVVPPKTGSTPVAGLSALTALDTAAAAAAAADPTAGTATIAPGTAAAVFGAASGGSTENRTAAPDDTVASPATGGVEPIGQATRGGVRAARKDRPVPVAPQWVHPMPEGVVTSCFGPRWGRLHAGVDLAAASGTPIRAAGAGTVVRAGSADGYGLAVLIDHGNGYLTHYGHMSEIGVVTGQQVTAGQEIGKEGSTGHSTGPHLHFEVHDGSYKNPIEPTAWMLARGVDVGGC